MENFKQTYEKFDASVLQQLYKKITDEDGRISDKNVFPVALVQSVFDAITGIRLDDILSHYNYLYIQYKGSQSATRLTVPIAHRRKTLVISYIDYDGNTIIEQYMGNTINDNDWQDSNNWKVPFTEGTFIANILDSQVKDALSDYIDNHDLSQFMITSLRYLLEENPDIIDNLIYNKIDDEEKARENADNAIIERVNTIDSIVSNNTASIINNKNEAIHKFNTIDERLDDVQDTLTSDSTVSPLSANQGKVLKELIDAKVIESGSVPIDGEPIEGNTEHLVSSDGIYNAFAKLIRVYDGGTASSKYGGTRHINGGHASN